MLPLFISEFGASGARPALGLVSEQFLPVGDDRLGAIAAGARWRLLVFGVGLEQCALDLLDWQIPANAGDSE